MLKEIVENHLNGLHYQIVIFGSRAKGTAKRYSDIDLALIGDQPVPGQTAAALAEAFEESNLPYTIDIVDFGRASPALKKEINEYGTELARL